MHDPLAVLLARIQFAVTAGFHFLFPPTTLGLTLTILVIETLYLKTKDEVYKKLSAMLVKILGVIFVAGIATGITLEFAFGNNWASYSRVVGDVFGAPLAAEGVFAFFLESVFLAILVWGRDKVSEKAYWWSAFFVFFGSHLSGLWIIIANSWMQTPAGFKVVGNKAILTNFFEAALNYSTIERYLHTIAAGWITGTLLASGIASYYLLKDKFKEEAKKLIKVSLTIFFIVSLIQIVLGHFHSVQVAKTQPLKLATFESLWETKKGAPLSLFAIPNEKEEKNTIEIGIPKLLSWLIYFDSDKEILGLKDPRILKYKRADGVEVEIKKEERPPVWLVYWSYHIMIGLGFLFPLIGLLGIIFMKNIEQKKWFLKILLLSIPLPYISNTTGWITAEVGRQPWAVYGIIKTSEAASSVVPAWQVALTLVGFTVVYTFIGILVVRIIINIVKKGPSEVKSGY